VRYNRNPLIQATHNCWAYGMDVLDPAQLTQCIGKPKSCRLMYHQPGSTQNLSSALHADTGRQCSVVERLMLADESELQRTTFEAKCPKDSSKIAMVVDPGDDYHFYRQDSNGLWSHKDGANPVKRYDAEKQFIWDPRTAGRDYRPRSYLNYKNFCGFYCAPRRKTVRLARDPTS
jgi:hypothetical protein